MTLVSLRLGFVEQDLVDQFGVSQSTLSWITCTRILRETQETSLVATTRRGKGKHATAV